MSGSIFCNISSNSYVDFSFIPFSKFLTQYSDQFIIRTASSFFITRPFPTIFRKSCLFIQHSSTVIADPIRKIIVVSFLQCKICITTRTEFIAIICCSNQSLLQTIMINSILRNISTDFICHCFQIIGCICHCNSIANCF